MKKFQLNETGGEPFKTALGGEDDIVLFDGKKAVARVIPVTAKSKVLKDRAFFTHYPHDTADCMGTCWRHALDTSKVKA